jgi:hypothetical protein
MLSTPLLIPAGRPSVSRRGVSGCGGTAVDERRCASWTLALLLCALAAASLAWQSMQVSLWHSAGWHLHHSAYRGGPSPQYLPTGTHGRPRQHQQPSSEQQRRLLYPVWWHAPFYTGSGYGSEAISYVASLLHHGQLRPADLWIAHSGDRIVPGAAAALDAGTRGMLEVRAPGMR